MKPIDWGLVKLQYEIFGETVQDIATEYDTTPRFIQHAIDNEGWKRLPVADALRDWTNIESVEDIPPDMVDQVRDRMNILFTLKQSSLNPRYIAIEAAILGKAQGVIQNLDPDHPNAESVLKAISEVFTSLRDVAGPGGRNAQAEESKGITVQVMTRSQSDKKIEQGVKVDVQGGVVQTTPPDLR